QERVPVLDAVHDVGDHEEADEDEREDDCGVVAEELGGGRPPPALALRLDAHPPVLPFCRSASPPTIITPTTIAPWITCAQFWSTLLMIRIVLISVSTNAAAIGPTRPPTPPSSETPPSTTAATELSV